MIYTITLNPSLDRTIDVEEFVYDDVNMIVKEKRSVGGKGIDVARVVNRLGGQCTVLGFIGGYNGIEIEGRLVNEGIVCDFTRTNGETRENVVIHQTKKKAQTFLATNAAEIEPFDATTFLNRIRQVPKSSHVAMSGRLPPGLSDNFYAQIIICLKGKGASTFLDADGDALKLGVQAGPSLVKLNIHEFGRLAEKTIKEQEEVIDNASSYLDLSDYIVVSMGARGAVGVSKNETIIASPPKVTVKSSIGAGDALMAGIAYGFSQEMSFHDCMILGVACGTASSLTANPAYCTKEDIISIKNQVTTKRV